MVGGAKYYIIFNFFKYILISIFIFIGLIWVSQILRVLDLQHTISFQILDVMKTTILVLPSFISPISSFLLLLASFFLNYKLNSSNEIIIFKQYLKYNDFKYLFIMIMTIIFVINFLNKEFFSVNTYHKYKIEELEIRNNLKNYISLKGMDNKTRVFSYECLTGHPYSGGANQNEILQRLKKIFPSAFILLIFIYIMYIKFYFSRLYCFE